MEENNRKIEEQQKKMAEERLKMVEDQMKIEQDTLKLKKKEEKKLKKEQMLKDDARPQIGFSLAAVWPQVTWSMIITLKRSGEYSL